MISTLRPTTPLVATFITALLFSGTPRTSYATSRVYVGNDNSSWNTAANWSPSGVPVAGDDVTLGTSMENATQNLDVTFNATYPSSALNSLTLNSSGLPAYMILNQTASSSAMFAITENIGTTSPDNTYNQSAGTNTTDNLNVGVGSNSTNNSYNISGTGTLNVGGTTGSMAGVMAIGVSGTGVVNQTGGTVTVLYDGAYSYNTAALALGENASGVGTYNLSGGALTSGFEFIGFYGGTGVFNQTGGTNACGETIYLGQGTSGVGAGTYNLSGGTLTGGLSITTGGTFNLLTGGTGNVSLEVGGGLFKFAGGAFSSQGFVSQEGGAIVLNGNSPTFNGLIATGGVIYNGATGDSTLTIAGDSVNNVGFSQAAGAILQDGGTGKLSLNLTGGETSLFGGMNTYTGTTTISAGVLQAASNTGFSSGSAFVVNGGTLDAFGYNVTVGSLAGTGGVVSVGNGSLTAGGNNTSTSFAGAMTGTGAFDKAGSGTLTLTSGGSFSGTINIQGGSLAVGAANGLPVASNVVIGNGASLNAAASQTLASLSDGNLATVNFTNNSTLTVGSGNTSVSMGTVFNGNGTFVKTGTGNLTLGYGSGDSFGANQDTGLAFMVNVGQLTLNKNAGSNAVAGPLTINGGSVVLAASNQIADTSVVTLGGGIFNLAGFSETIGGLSGAGTVTIGGGTLTVAQTGTSTFGGLLGGPGAFVMGGTGTLTLINPGSYGGTFAVNSGQLTLQGTVNGTGFTANSGGTLLLSGVALNLNAGSLLANAGGTVQYSSATINNGYLRGSGTQTLLSGGTSTFNGVTTYNSTVIAQNGTGFFNNFTNGGTLNNNAALTFNGGTNASTGTINVSNTFNTQDFGNNGVVTINNGGTVSNSGSNFVAGGGSRTTINSGGTLSTASGTSIELNGALLTNNGTQNGLLDVNYGSSARGSGVFGTVNVTTGGKFGNNAVDGGLELQVGGTLHLSPSRTTSPMPFVGPQLSTSPTTITVGGMLLGAGSNLGINVQNAQGAAGTGYDTFHDLGALTLSGSSTPGNQIIISLASLNASGNPGTAQNFDPTRFYAFTLVTADGGITGYNSEEFAVDTTGFANALNGGSFTVAENGDQLLLDFSPPAVPEPRTALIFGLPLIYMVARRMRAAQR